jgi:phage baseplate assembly protein W
MAFGSKQIFPNDLKPRVAIGVDIPFNAPGVFRSNYQTKDAIKSNLLNIFLTNQGERIANPGFGVGLRDFIFEQISTQNLSGLQENIQEQVQGYIPGINIISLDITGNPDQNKVNISLAYSLPNTNIEDKIEVTFS